MKERNVIILGGDLRQYYMAKSLVERDFAISYYGLLFPNELPQVHRCRDKEEMWEKMGEKSTALVLPVPITLDGTHVRSNSLSDDKIQLEELLLHVIKEQRIFGGEFSDGLKRRLLEKKVQIEDVASDDIYGRNSTAPVAESAIVEAELLSDETIYGSRSLVLGCGRYGKALAERLQAWGSKVTMALEFPAAVKTLPASQMRFSAEHIMVKQNEPYESYGFHGSDEPGWNFVFRTTSQIPLDAEFLNRLSPNTVIIDIADVPDGVDYEYAKKQGITVCFCPGVAGKYAAKTAGEILAEIIWKKISE